MKRDGIKLLAKNGHVAFAPFSAFPRLAAARIAARRKFRLMATGIHFEEIDEDVSYDSIVHLEDYPQTLSLDFRSLSDLKALNVSELSRRLGIQQSLMAAYIAGKKKPSLERAKMIVNEIHAIGRELANFNISSPHINIPSST